MAVRVHLPANDTTDGDQQETAALRRDNPVNEISH
jgi:hypothetical protein